VHNSRSNFYSEKDHEDPKGTKGKGTGAKRTDAKGTKAQKAQKE
jgi:hypothetical protein